jgi:hypothetical protein
MAGWIKLHRSLNDHWIYNEKRKFSKLEAWIDILMTVNYEDKKVLVKGKLYDVKRGQSILSLDTWSKRWSWDKSSARRFFNLLQKDSMIDVISDNITTHLTVCKYDSYQGIENANETQTKHKRNSNEIQTTPTKESKEYKEEKENKNNSEIPNFETVLIYISNFLQENNKQMNDRLKMSLKAKYDSWLENDWKDGHGNKITNWKTKFKNSLDFMSAYKDLFEMNKTFKSSEQIKLEDQIKKNIQSISKGMYEISALKEYCRQHWKFGIEELKKIDNFPLKALPE